MDIQNRRHITISLQVSSLENIPAGNYNNGTYFLVKNITDDNITVSVKLYNDDEFIETVLYPGWNPEIISEISNAEEGTLQAGY